MKNSGKDLTRLKASETWLIGDQISVSKPQRFIDASHGRKYSCKEAVVTHEIFLTELKFF